MIEVGCDTNRDIEPRVILSIPPTCELTACDRVGPDQRPVDVDVYVSMTAPQEFAGQRGSARSDHATRSGARAD